MAKQNSSFKIKLGTRSPDDLPEKGALQFDEDTGLPVMGDGTKWVPIERTRDTIGVRLTSPVVEALLSGVPEVVKYYDDVTYDVLEGFSATPAVGTEIAINEPMVFDAIGELELSSDKNNTTFTIYSYLGALKLSTRTLQTGTKNIPVSYVGIGPIVVSAANPFRIEIEADKNCDLTIHSATTIMTRQPD